MSKDYTLTNTSTLVLSHITAAVYIVNWKLYVLLIKIICDIPVLCEGCNKNVSSTIEIV